MYITDNLCHQTTSTATESTESTCDESKQIGSHSSHDHCDYKTSEELEEKIEICDDSCVNILRLSKSKGDGLIATRDIKAGELILKESGILIDNGEQGYKNAFKLMKEKHATWLKILPYYPNKISKQATEFEIFKSQVNRCGFARYDDHDQVSFNRISKRIL